MGTVQRSGYALFATLALAVGGVIYAEVFTAELVPLATETHSGPFSSRVTWLDQLVPVILVGLLLAVWLWVIWGAVQEERTVQRRRRL